MWVGYVSKLLTGLFYRERTNRHIICRHYQVQRPTNLLTLETNCVCLFSVVKDTQCAADWGALLLLCGRQLCIQVRGRSVLSAPLKTVLTSVFQPPVSQFPHSACIEVCSCTLHTHYTSASNRRLKRLNVANHAIATRYQVLYNFIPLWEKEAAWTQPGPMKNNASIVDKACWYLPLHIFTVLLSIWPGLLLYID